MKLPQIQLDVATLLAEFDVWITPSLSEIRDTDRFAAEMETVVRVFDSMSTATDGFADPKTCKPEVIADLFVELTSTNSEQSIILLNGLASVLFLVTGRSDNNAKCQLPLFLRDHGGWSEFPFVRRRGGIPIIVGTVEIPRVLKSDKIMDTVVALSNRVDHKRALLREFVGFVLSTDKDVNQLWSVGKSYVMMKEFGKERDLLTPLVVFQVRGSVSASGGHGPEDLLRDRFDEWGLIRDVDYNTTDVIVARSNTGGDRAKTRAYDFVLPYQTPGWTPRVFVQCQFYAGDSGSVSHKNVDQTGQSRGAVSQTFDQPMFVEYVDGAGYFSSLNGDLANLLSMDDTASFFQIRSAPIRVRRALQEIGFLTPLEVAHAIIRSASKVETTKILQEEGYTKTEIDRVIGASSGIDTYIQSIGNQFVIAADRVDWVRRYFLLDVAACFGEDADGDRAKLAGSLAIPGYGPFYGMKIDELISRAVSLAPTLKKQWSRPESPLEDIRWLCEQGYAMSA